MKTTISGISRWVTRDRGNFLSHGNFKAFLVAILLIATASTAHAGSFGIGDLEFIDGAYATGTFHFSNGVYTSVNIDVFQHGFGLLFHVSQADNQFPVFGSDGYTYEHFLSLNPPPPVVNLLSLVFQTPLDAPGLKVGQDIMFGGNTEYGYKAEVGTLSFPPLLRGFLVVEGLDVPEPSSILLILGLMLGGLVALISRSRATREAISRLSSRT